MDAAEKQTVRVSILNRLYTLRSTGDSREVEALAASVDDLMQAIASKAPNADNTHVAVLACLHLADSLRQLERELTELKDRVGRKSEQFAGMLEQLIASAGEE